MASTAPTSQPVQSHTTGRTLIVSWHWAPTKRASTQVLSNLFGAANPSDYVVLTRRMQADTGDDPTEIPPLPTTHASWPIASDEDGRLGTWFASIWTALRMWFSSVCKRELRSTDRVLAVYPHRYSLLVGWLIARTLGKPLVVYMHDLFAETLIARNKMKRSFWTRMDRRIIEAAELVVVPTREFAEHYQRRGAQQTWVIPHCVPASDKPVDLPRLEGDLKLTYAGSIYQAHEDAIARFVQATKDAANVVVTFLSQPHDLLKEQSVQWLDRASAYAKLAESHVLVVVLGHDTPYPEEVQGCFPSKMVDYLALGRPILAIVPPGSFVDRYVTETGCGVSVTSRDPDDIRAAIEAFRYGDRLAQFAAASQTEAKRLSAVDWIERLTERIGEVGGVTMPSQSCPARPRRSYLGRFFARRPKFGA